MLVLMTTGCAYFVPSAIKREASLVSIEMGTALKQVPPMQKKAEEMLAEADKQATTGEVNATAEAYRKAAVQAIEATNKMLRSYKRAMPHADNLERYMLRQPPKEE